MAEYERRVFWNSISDFYSTSDYPTGSDIFVNNFYAEGAGLKDKFENTRWQEVSNDTVIYFRSDLQMFSTTGFTYFLPKFLDTLLNEPVNSDTLIDHFISRLSFLDNNFINNLINGINYDDANFIYYFFNHYESLFSEPDLRLLEYEYILIKYLAQAWKRVRENLRTG